MAKKFLIVGDLHGNRPKIYFKDFDAIIAPGDFCSDAPRKYMFQALREKLEKKSKVEWYEIVGRKKAKKMIEKSLLDGRKVLEYLNSFGVPVYVVPGNWDWTKDESSGWDFLRQDHYLELIKALPNIVDVHCKIINLGDYQIIGYGECFAPEYPQYEEDLKLFSRKELKRKRENYERILNKISALFEKASKSVIFLSHNVPFNTPLDKITNKNSPRYGYHYGSLVVREIIEKYQPLVCIGGHIHENFGKCRIGKTICINSGYGANVNTFLELSGNKVKKLEFCKGAKMHVSSEKSNNFPIKKT